MPKLKIALIDDNAERAEFIQDSLTAHDFIVVACLIVHDLSMAHVKNLQADVILLNMDHPHRDIIESCVSQYELPTVLFTQNSNKDTIKSAIDAGVTAYIVDGIDPSKLNSIMEISIEQFHKHKKLRDVFLLFDNLIVLNYLQQHYVDLQILFHHAFLNVYLIF